MCAHIHAHLDGHLTLQALGRFAEMSPSHLQRKFKASVGISPREYVDQKRLEAFKRGARRGDSVTESLYGAGFGAGSRLYEQAHRRLGMTPAEYRRGGAGVRIHSRLLLIVVSAHTTKTFKTSFRYLVPVPFSTNS